MHILFSQVTDLTAELEKERSKVHSMKTELDRLKVGTLNEIPLGIFY